MDSYFPSPPPPSLSPSPTVVVVGFSTSSYTVMEGERQVTLRVIKTGNTAQSIPVEYFTTGNGSALGERFPILSVSRMYSDHTHLQLVRFDVVIEHISIVTLE